MLEYIKSKRLTIAEVLSIATNIYKQNIKTITFVGFFIIIPLFLFNQWIISQTVINLNYLQDNIMDIDMVAQVNAMTSASLYNVIASLVQMVVQPLASIAIIWGAINIVKEQKSSAKNNFLYSFSKAPAAIWTTFLQVIFLFLIICPFLIFAVSFLSILRGALMTISLIIVVIAFVVVIIYFSTIWTFADCVVAIQNISCSAALSASKRAAQVRFLEILLYIIIYSTTTFFLGSLVVNALENISPFLSDTIYMLCCMVWSFVRYIVFDGFFIMILVVLFLNRIWANTENTTSINKIEGEVTAQTEQQNTDLQKEVITEQQNTVDLEKMPKIEQQNTVNLEKTSEQIAQQKQNETDDIEKH